MNFKINSEIYDLLCEYKYKQASQFEEEFNDENSEFIYYISFEKNRGSDEGDSIIIACTKTGGRDLRNSSEKIRFEDVLDNLKIEEIRVYGQFNYIPNYNFLTESYPSVSPSIVLSTEGNLLLTGSNFKKALEVQNNFSQYMCQEVFPKVTKILEKVNSKVISVLREFGYYEGYNSFVSSPYDDYNNTELAISYVSFLRTVSIVIDLFNFNISIGFLPSVKTLEHLEYLDRTTILTELLKYLSEGAYVNEMVLSDFEKRGIIYNKESRIATETLLKALNNRVSISELENINALDVPEMFSDVFLYALSMNEK